MEHMSTLLWPGWPGPGRRPLFFIFIFGSHRRHGRLGILFAGRRPRRGIFGLDTTRGDRLFITLLGSAFIFLAWLGIFGVPLWGGLALALLWAFVVFRWVISIALHGRADPTTQTSNDGGPSSRPWRNLLAPQRPARRLLNRRDDLLRHRFDVLIGQGLVARLQRHLDGIGFLRRPRA